jgi:uncharacterized cupin superfamily protein
MNMARPGAHKAHFRTCPEVVPNRPKAFATLNQQSRNFQYIGQKHRNGRRFVHFIQHTNTALSPQLLLQRSTPTASPGAKPIMSIESIVDFSAVSTQAQRYRPAAEKILKGDPQQTLYNHYDSPCGQMSAGVWEGEVGQWKVNYTEHEYCEIVQGVSVLRDEDGNAKTLRAGDRFVIPAGFSGTWEVLEACRKIYVVFERKA